MVYGYGSSTTAQASKLPSSNLILPSLPMESGGEDEVQMIGTGGQLVPVASDGSPSKRPRQVDSLANHDIVHLIQQTISTSLEGHLGRIQDSLTNIVHDQASQSSRLKKLEDQASKQQLTLGEIQQSHSQRMDTLQAEIVQLQKHSAPTSPHASPTHSPLAYRAAGPTEDPSFDLVLGGWKEGRSRENISIQINTALSEANLLTGVSELKLFGKRPTIGKVVLKFREGMTMQEKRISNSPWGTLFVKLCMDWTCGVPWTNLLSWEASARPSDGWVDSFKNGSNSPKITWLWALGLWQNVLLENTSWLDWLVPPGPSLQQTHLNFGGSFRMNQIMFEFGLTSPPWLLHSPSHLNRPSMHGMLTSGRWLLVMVVCREIGIL